MTKIGKQVIKIPKQVKIRFEQETLFLQGSLGNEKIVLPKNFQVIWTEKEIEILPKEPLDRKSKKLWGTLRNTLRNKIKGINQGFSIKLKLVGIGYKATLHEEFLQLKLGFSHLIVLKIPYNIKVELPIPSRIRLKGMDLPLLTQFAATIRKYKKPEPYKGKGILYNKEKIKLKEGKKK